MFFLIVGLTDSYTEFNNLRKGEKTSSSQFFNGVTEGWSNYESDKDSINTEKTDSHTTSNDSIKQTEIDTVPKKKKGLFLNVAGEEVKIDKLIKFQKKHPNINIDNALDSLQMHKTFWNRFWYTRAGVINTLIENKGEDKKLYKQFLSYTSIALFILLPLFTLFLKFIYIRRKYTYVEHLVFVFHVQTVFFLLFSVFYLISFVNNAEYAILLFLGLFLIYLFMAMKRFYQQGFFKTFCKFLLANLAYLIISLIGITAISLIAFAMY